MQAYEIFTQDGCFFCIQAKSLLEERNIPYVEYNITNDSEAKAMLLERYPSAKTVPQIFSFGKHVGGYEDLVRYIEETSGGYGDGQF